MTKELHHRDIERIDSPAIQRGMTDAHRVRPLVAPDNFAATDPFLLLMEDWFPLGVFDRHPHRGIETITYVLDGAVDHYDNHGNTGVISPGDVLWLTAGRGLIHNEQPANGKPVHLLQLWLNLPAGSKLVPAHFQELRATDMPVRREPGAEIRLFSGSSGTETALTINYVPILLAEVKLDAGARIEQLLPSGYNGFVVVLEGNGLFGTSNADVGAGKVAWLTKSDVESVITIRGGARGLRAVLFAGRPLQEPIAARGPFVMNTQEELDIAFREFRRSGERFGL